jgi:molybdopterin-containing oxidoreductase family iron-sulfur binding subunit
VAASAGERSDEFAPGASEWLPELSRRRFLELMGASLALAGLGACNRPPQKTIVPYVTPPERDLLDATLYYATAMPWEGYARGLLALSHSGRPTKLEGSPAHPDSLGATDILMQAAVLSLYDPDRSRTPRRHDLPVAWSAFEDEWLAAHRELTDGKGAGLAVLTEPTTSPTFLRGIHELLDRFPAARWYQHTPLSRYDDQGEQEDYDFARADVVLAIDADFLFSHPSSLRYARAFAGRRRIDHGKVNANRLYAIEPAPSITGSMADHHLPASPDHLRRLLVAIENALEGRDVAGTFTDHERRVVRAIARDLRARAPNVLCVAGEHTGPDVRAWAARMNARLHADGNTRHALPAVRSDADPRAAGDLSALVQAMDAGKITTLVVASANPAYTAPRDVPFAAALKKVRRRIHLGMHHDETAALCEWHIPESHFLESWADVRAYDGTASIIQPLISPLYESRSPAELLFFLSTPLGRPDYDLVRETWQKAGATSGDFEAAWRQWLNQGVIDGTANSRTPPKAAPDAGRLSAPAPARELTIVIRPDPNVRDGRWANHGWLQELPKPNTQLVWDNPALISPEFAGAHDLKNGDLLTLRTAGAAVDVAVWVAPGVANDCVLVYLGYGRTRAGLIGTSLGFDAYAFREARRPWLAPVVETTRKDGRVLLVSTHAHFSMEGRDLVRTAKATDPERTAGRPPETPPSLYPEWKYDGYRWGMLIDLGTCIGCKACVIACQAENNTPVVGKDQVSRGREMHWIRVDQYYDGDPSNPDILHQPVPCMQCEKAPCELVCPTAATVHSSEGLNDMVYNRCIGTRYCSNNCPYKVRRFNFLDYREPRDSPVYLQKNPDVTVRARGVMEKCTYCVQRINAARITAEREDRRIRDGEVRTACQQACPTEAIVFGDLNDPKSKVRARKAEPTHYVLLEELNTQPRTTYLAKTTNKSDAVLTPAHDHV